MLNYIVIFLALLIFISVIYITAKAVSRGIDARQNRKIEEPSKNEISDLENDNIFSENKKNLSDELGRLNKLKLEGILTEEEFKKAKEKLLN